MNRYDLVRQIGKGSFGSVFLAHRRSDGAQFVIKKLAIKNVSDKELANYQNEVTLLKELSHIGIVSMIESFASHDRHDELCIVMSYCEGGDLSHYLDNRSRLKSPLQEKEIWYFFLQMSLALHYMHDKNILHRDLKTQNIFLKNGMIQLGDFGISKLLNNSTDFTATCIGTPYYMSPELFKNEKYNFKSDVWALGCIVYEMLTFKHAFDGNSLNNLAGKIIKGNFAGIKSSYSQELKDIVHRMLNVSPSKRPSIRELLLMPSIKNKLKSQVHILCKQKHFYRPADFSNFVRQLVSLGYGEMIVSDNPPPSLPPSSLPPSSQPSPLPPRSSAALRADFIQEQERARIEMDKKLSKLKARTPVIPPPPPARVESSVSATDRRRSGGKDNAVITNAASAADTRRVEERRREREEAQKREDAARRREIQARQAAERERLREAEARERERLHRQKQIAARREWSNIHARQQAERERREQEARIQAEQLQAERERIERGIRRYEHRAESHSTNTHVNCDEKESDSISDRDRVLARKQRERMEREAQERQQLLRAAAEYDARKQHAVQQNKAIINGLHHQPSSPSSPTLPSRSSHSHSHHPSQAQSQQSATPPSELNDEVEDLADLEADMAEYERQIQTLKTAMEVTAIIDELSEDDTDTHTNSDNDSEDGSEDDANEDGDDDSEPHPLFVSIEERLQLLGKECYRLCGRAVFVAAYDYLSQLHDSGERGSMDQQQLESALAKIMGERVVHWQLIDQLIFIESHVDDS